MSKLVEKNDDHRIYQSKYYIHVKKLGIKIYEYIFCSYDEKNEEEKETVQYYGWLIKDLNAKEIIYGESSTLEVVLSNALDKNAEEYVCDIYAKVCIE